MNGSSQIADPIHQRKTPRAEVLRREPRHLKMASINRHGTSISVADLLHHLPEGVLYDYQRILEHILSLQQRQHVQIIGITAAHANEGASTITAGLSLLAAARQVHYMNGAARSAKQEPSYGWGTSQNILLIDTQFKHPTLHQLLNAERQPGLIDCLESKTPWENGIKMIANSRLTFIPAGSPTQQTFYNLYLDTFYTLLEKAKRKYSIIFLDIPPLLQYAEGITLSKLCDGIVLIIKSAQTRWEAVQEANKLLMKANVNVLGAILNDHKSYIPQWLSRYF